MVGKFAREAAAALLRWSRIADQDQALGLIEKAADIKDRLEETSPSKANQNSLKAPDIET
jgi:hypothetical protein